MKHYLITLIVLVVIITCNVSNNSGKFSIPAPNGSSALSKDADALTLMLKIDTITFFEQMTDGEKEEFVSKNIKNQVVKDFWRTRKELRSFDYYFKVISSFDKSGQFFDFYFWCIDCIQDKKLIDGYFFDVIQKYYELVYENNRLGLFNYLRTQEAYNNDKKVNNILNYIGYSFQSIIQDDETYFNRLIDEDPLNRQYYERIEKSAIDNL